MSNSIEKSTVRVRPARPEDMAFVVAHAARMLEFGPPPWRDTAVMIQTDQRELAAVLLKPREDEAFFVAESVEPDPQPLGFVHLTTQHDYFTGEAHGHIGDIVVTKEAEGRGVGRVLMATAEAWAREKGYRLLTLNVFAQNQRAREVYEKAGFRIDTLKYLKPLTPSDG